MSSRRVTELRKRPRLPLSFPLFARGVDAQGMPFKELLTALNVSAGGMLVLNAEVVRTEQRARSKLVGLKFSRPFA
jgi:hypothetical protein